jgi:sugar phosphate isomerase/epimerase
VGEGLIDFRGQFAALRDDGYDGTMSLETGYSRPDGNKVESTRECLEGLFRVLKHVRIPYQLATHSESALESD